MPALRVKSTKKYMLIIEVKNLTKTFKNYKKPAGFWGSVKSLFHRQTITTKAVNNISFEISEGEFVGFLGPNGAGKTTTLKVLSGILHPDSCEVKILGHTPWLREEKLQKQIGIVMSQKDQLIWDIPPIDSYLLFKEIYEIPDDNFKKRLDELSALLDLKEVLNTPIRKLSLGKRMKCELIGAILHNPRVLFLDEPTIGLDVVSKKKMWDFLKKYNERQKTTIILTSHYMEDIKRLCKRVIIIDKGTHVYDGTLQKLMDKYVKNKTISVVFENEIDEKKLSEVGRIIEKEDFKYELSIPKAKISTAAATILNKFAVDDISISAPEAEEVIREIFEKNKK